MESGKPCFNLDKTYFTTLFEAGVSFNFSVGLVAIFDVRSWAKLVQLSTRPRLHKNSVGEWVNTEIDVWIFSSKDKGSNTDAYTNTANIKSRWELYYNAAKNLCKQLNESTNGTLSYKISTDIKYFCSENNGIYNIDVPAILHELFKEETKETDINALIEKIIRFDSRFALATDGIKEIDVCENADLAYTFELKKEQREQSIMQFHELLKTDTNTTIQAVLLNSRKDRQYKADTKALLGVPMVAKERVLELISSNKIAFATNEKHRVLTDLKFLVGEQKASLQDAVTTVIETDKKALGLAIDTHNLAQRIKEHKAGGNLHRNDKRQIEGYKAVIAKFAIIRNNIQKGKRKAEFTAVELAKITNDALQGKQVKALSAKSVINYLSLFYEFEVTRPYENGVQIKKYRILNVKKIR